MDYKKQEESGVVAIGPHPRASMLAYLVMLLLQHRGKWTAGMCTANGRQILRHADLGLVSKVFSPEYLFEGEYSIGQVRYSRNPKNRVLWRDGMQPYAVSCVHGPIALAFTGSITNSEVLKKKLVDDGAVFHSPNDDAELLLLWMAQFGELGLEGAVKESLALIEGAFALAILTPTSLIVARDRAGCRPLVMGQITLPDGSNTAVFSTEDSAFGLIKAKQIGEVKPAEMITVDKTGFRRQMFDEPKPRESCFLELSYLQAEAATVFGLGVRDFRYQLGVLLARCCPLEVDVVTFIPPKSHAIAEGYAHALGLPFSRCLERNEDLVTSSIVLDFEDIERFQLRFIPILSAIKDKRVAVFMSHLFGGQAARRLVRLFRGPGQAREVHLVVSVPPTRSTCQLGVDIRQTPGLIAGFSNLQGICKFTDADSVNYQSMDAMEEALGVERGNFCFRCFQPEQPLVQVS